MLSYLFYGLTYGVTDAHTIPDRTHSVSTHHSGASPEAIDPEPVDQPMAELSDRDRSKIVERLKRIFKHSPSNCRN